MEKQTVQISLSLKKSSLNKIKKYAKEMNVPYQTFLRTYIDKIALSL
ncbi:MULTISPECIES: CopG family antitoxin [Pasteurellaceae]|nr:CopG family antitoxin [Pasteurella atlantica]MBR0573566.1 hypothetical protein [Pasteurella atlantica]MDP8039572.1 CopG family antitoxin [Pasteurella atlantica]MDP8045884.1 CopG family antitoxin [Pasteurella atlantica]MDP8142391.1 CopG family antitoxin [Pasteurella atlantica]MDP8164598.1 CopG family antitoxin [Pasteurella atlantica]